MKNAAIIFARKNSKRLKNKNILDFAGKPLIAWSIEHALSVKELDTVIVSTDCNDIADIAKSYGAKVPFMRPSFLAEDKAPEWLSWQHAIKEIIKSSGVTPNLMVSIPTTSPLRSKIDIENCIKTFFKKNAEMVISITDSYRNPFYNIVKVSEDGTIDNVINNTKIVHRSQDAPKTYDITTVAYAASPNYILHQKHMFAGKVYYNYVPKERAIDIDDPYDFEVAEFLMLKKLGINK